ncbi:LysE family translocator [Rhodanobacter umsongensis]|uniref:LysE family translocator n=1 Tax=Rhodanobacter umsongensis TaxID=633153 RepID=A0ABW0JHW3_9GAMM
MDRLIALAGLLCIAAITPGPNNLVVLRAAGHGGIRAAVPAIAGIVLGGLLLLALAVLGAGAALLAHPSLKQGIGAIGSLYLAWLGVSLCVGGVSPRQSRATSAEPVPAAGALGLLGFQFLNPKSWVMVLTALAALPAAALRDYLPLAGLFVLIPTVCLLLWAALGAWLARWLVRPVVRRGVDIVMGVLLVACASLLLLEP